MNNSQNLGGNSFEELQESLNFSWTIISESILKDLQSTWKIDPIKIRKFNELKDKKGNSYVMENFFREVKIWLNDHDFPHQKRQEIVTSMKEWKKLIDLIWGATYKELEEIILGLFDKLVKQWDDNTTSNNEEYLGNNNNNEQLKQQKKFGNFIKKHMDKLGDLWNPGFGLVLLLFNHDVMSKQELLDTFLDGNDDESGEDRLNAEKIISEMIELWIIKEEWKNLSLNYDWEVNVLPTVQNKPTSLDKKPKKNIDSKETPIKMTLQQRELDITEKITKMKIEELSSSLNTNEKLPTDYVQFSSMTDAGWGNYSEVKIPKKHPLMPILEYAKVLLEKHHNNHQDGVDLWSVFIEGKEVSLLPIEVALKNIFHPIYSGNGKLIKWLPKDAEEIILCLENASRRNQTGNKFSIAAFNLICNLGDRRSHKGLSNILKEFTSDLTS